MCEGMCRSRTSLWIATVSFVKSELSVVDLLGNLFSSSSSNNIQDQCLIIADIYGV